MARVFVTMGAVAAMLMLGIVALQYRYDEVSSVGLTGNNQTALNLTRRVAVDSTTILGNALPRLFVVILFVFVVGYFVLVR